MSTLPHTSLSLPDPGKSPVPTKTLTRWDTFIGDLASGLGIAESMEKCYITRADIETMCRLDDGGLQLQRFNDAERAGRKRSWTVFEFKDIFGFIAEGMTIKEAQMAAVGRYAASFAQLIVEDSELNAMYRTALEARSLGVGEEILGITDDDSKDIIINDKGPAPNMAAVSRSKLRAEVRLRVAGQWNNRLYGEKKDQVNVQVNINHAERLEEARSRAQLQDKRVTPKQMQNAVEAVFSEKPAADADTTWMDDKPADAVWREEQ